MTMPNHLVDAKIAEARARGELQHPRTDEARLLRELAELLEALQGARGPRAGLVRAQLRRRERSLADLLDRTGRSVLADALWDEDPIFEE